MPVGDINTGRQLNAIPNTITCHVGNTCRPVTNANAGSLSITVNNVAPELGTISVDPALVPVNTAISTSAVFTDPGTIEHTGV
jgi:hypothetical protein